MANQYVVRDQNGSASSPLTLDQVESKIRNGEIKPDDMVSIYPNEFALAAKEYSEFESFFIVDDEKTILFDHNKKVPSAHEEKTNIGIEEAPVPDADSTSSSVPATDDFDPELRQQSTMVFERPEALIRDKAAHRQIKKSKLPKRSFLILILLALVMYDTMFDDDENSSPEIVMVPVRPQLPAGGVGKVDPQKSAQIYTAGLKPYIEDTVSGYRRAADIFQLALRYDPQNVKALAMLASSYLNLIDSSNKDENTFSVINKLIELSKLKELDLVETLLAQVEFLAASHRYDAAVQRLIEYSKVSGKFDPILYYYLAWLYVQKGEFANAAKYLNLIPASALPMPKLYYLRGYLHEENKEYDEAIADYKRALNLNTQHAKSILGIVRVNEKKGELKQVLRYVEFLTSNPGLQSPSEYVSALIYRSKLALLYQKQDEAILSLERAIRIDPKNENLRLEFYSLLSQQTKNSKYKDLAQMYANVLEGERFFRAGKYHEATAVYLQAADAFPRSEIPLEKLGDLFYQTGEYLKAEMNYKKALEINPRSAETAIKLIDAQIRNHDWDDAQQYLARYRTHPQLKSSIDRLAGDLAFHQGNFQSAITFYRKSMARDTIDTEVYASYASALRELDQCKDAQFFYSLAQRLDPFNYSAIIGSAKCFLKTDNVDVAVSRIQEELGRLPKARADLIVGIAEIYYLAHEDERALHFLAQAKELDPDYPETYKIEGLIYLRGMITKKELKRKAIDAFKSYSDRKLSDPMGYIQRFEIFLKDSNFEQAAEELNRVFEVSPRYPELHYRRAQLYIKMGRSKDALNELSEELKLNPRFVKSWVEQGNIYMRANNLDLATQSFVKAMELDPMDASAKLGAANVNYMRRQFSSAIALYQSALALDRGNPEIYKRLGYAYRDSGDQAKAAKAFRGYLDLAPDAPDRADFEKYK
ncbi:MAG: tetratricopeptide repeat protein [Bdellovibrionales bacterium]|nr:tetratricopeptide repeat protein [Bdellovibrionales bacterium]